MWVATEAAHSMTAGGRERGESAGEGWRIGFGVGSNRWSCSHESQIANIRRWGSSAEDE